MTIKKDTVRLMDVLPSFLEDAVTYGLLKGYKFVEELREDEEAIQYTIDKPTEVQKSGDQFLHLVIQKMATDITRELVGIADPVDTVPDFTDLFVLVPSFKYNDFTKKFPKVTSIIAIDTPFSDVIYTIPKGEIDFVLEMKMGAEKLEYQLIFEED